jgi:sulfite oxidase
MNTRRELLAMLASAAAGGSVPRLNAQTPKRDMIVRSARPEDYELPINGFDSWITPIDRFFVRSHHYTPKVDPAQWKLELTGLVDAPFSLTLDELRKMPRVELVSVLECAGNGRGLFEPSMPGIQWTYGAVGNARWAGVRLADVLTRAKLKTSARHLLFRGADQPVATQPKFERSVPLERCLDRNTLLAYEMNGQPLPVSHGAPLRLVVPGWAGDSWVKWLTEVRALEKEHDGFYMKTAYRHPGKPVPPGIAIPPEQMMPVEGLVLKSVISTPETDSVLKPGPVRIAGAAWSGATPVASVEVSVDRGRTWQKAQLTRDSAPFGWRLWQHSWTPKQTGHYLLMVRAFDTAGRTQPLTEEWNPSGYSNNRVHMVPVEISESVPKAEPAPVASQQSPDPKFQPPSGYRAACLTCHEEDIIMQQRLSRAQWEAETNKMIRWGARVPDDQRGPILDYLLRLYGPRPRR